MSRDIWIVVDFNSVSKLGDCQMDYPQPQAPSDTRQQQWVLSGRCLDIDTVVHRPRSAITHRIMSSARRLSTAVGMPMLWLMYRDWFMSNRCGHFGVNSKFSHRCIDSNSIEMRRGSIYRKETRNAAIEIVANKLGDIKCASNSRMRMESMFKLMGNRHYGHYDGNKYFFPSTTNENHSHPFFSLVPLRCHVMWCHCCLLNGPHAQFKCKLNRRLCFCYRLPFTKYHNTWAMKCI